MTTSHIPIDPALLARIGAASRPEAAALYAAAGLPVFPCAAGGKRPLTAHGFHDASTNTKQVDSWWRSCPEANIGLRTGHGVDVLDVDQHQDRSGFPALARLQHTGLLHGWFAAVRSPAGGLHLYYPSPADAQASWSRLGAQIDFRGSGGYIIAPPSRIIRPDGTSAGYRLIAARDGGRPVGAETIRALLTPPRRLAPVPAEARSRDNFAQAGQLTKWVANLGEGSRNTGLFWAACRAAELHTDAQAALVEAAVTAGLEHDEAAATITSAYRTVARAAEIAPPTATGTRASLARGALGR